MSADVTQMEGLQQQTPESTQSPIFEPQCPAQSVPVATMLPLSSSSTTNNPTLDAHIISPHMQRLRDIEADANRAILSWGSGGAESAVPAKRKSMYLALAANYTNLCQSPTHSLTATMKTATTRKTLRKSLRTIQLNSVVRSYRCTTPASNKLRRTLKLYCRSSWTFSKLPRTAESLVKRLPTFGMRSSRIEISYTKRRSGSL